MTAQQVMVGGVYGLKIGNRVTEAEVTADLEDGWEVTSKKSGKVMRIKNPERLIPLDDSAAATENSGDLFSGSKTEVEVEVTIVDTTPQHTKKYEPNIFVVRPDTSGWTGEKKTRNDNLPHCCGCGKELENRGKWYCSGECKDLAKKSGKRHCWHCGREISKGMSCPECAGKK